MSTDAINECYVAPELSQKFFACLLLTAQVKENPELKNAQTPARF